jgi:hypothetical protein
MFMGRETPSLPKMPVIETIDDFRNYVKNTIEPFFDHYGFYCLEKIEKESDKELIHLQHYLQNKILEKGKLGKCVCVSFKKEENIKYLAATIVCPKFNKTFEINGKLQSYFYN